LNPACPLFARCAIVRCLPGVPACCCCSRSLYRSAIPLLPSAAAPTTTSLLPSLRLPLLPLPLPLTMPLPFPLPLSLPATACSDFLFFCNLEKFFFATSTTFRCRTCLVRTGRDSHSLPGFFHSRYVRLPPVALPLPLTKVLLSYEMGMYRRMHAHDRPYGRMTVVVNRWVPICHHSSSDRRSDADHVASLI
jgi:hypothetical protein